MTMPTLLLRIYGVVQGVGFRPCASRLAQRFHLTGSVANCGSFVELHLQGEEAEKRSFLETLQREAPERAAILKIEQRETQEEPFSGFSIVTSRREHGDHFVSPDIAICSRCQKELYDRKDRRYLHPFINCTACGPRLTILESMPYDRERTSMKSFPMCPECAKEYVSPASRRFDAQPVCCPQCGPDLSLCGRPERGLAALRLVRKRLKAGEIAAVKGIGGFHLVCDAHNAESIRELRKRKKRPRKPFAVMFRDEAALRRYCAVTPAELAELSGPRRPIVLLPRLKNGGLPEELAPDNPMLGAMLPYAPVQLLLFDCGDGDEMTDALVMTSGNVAGAPICIDAREAGRQFGSFCDLFLDNDRPILLRADDSILSFSGGKPYLIRRSRGFAPLPFSVSGLPPGSVFGIGGELKNTFCFGKNGLFYPSAYIGDIGDMRSLVALDESMEQMQKLLEITPQVAGCDLHPHYRTSVYAEQLGIPLVRVQHHYAHILSCMAEHDFCRSEVLGIACDGTGYGTDGTVWGGEFLRCSTAGFTRLGSIMPFQQPGGDAAVREGYHIALSMLFPLCGDAAEKTMQKLCLCSEREFQMQKAIAENHWNTITSTSTGRLFDAVSALLGFCRISTFEGEAAMALQFAAERAGAGDMEEFPALEQTENFFHLRTDLLFARLLARRMAGEPPDVLAYAFHAGLARLLAAGAVAAREKTHLSICALSGGVFQNLLLLRLCKNALEQAGFQVLCNEQIPANDSGIALGQAVAALVHPAGK